MKNLSKIFCIVAGLCAMLCNALLLLMSLKGDIEFDHIVAIFSVMFMVIAVMLTDINARISWK